jgi:hypothetical protein
MTDAESSTPSEGHDPSIALEPDFDEYGLHDKDNTSTVIIRIDHDTHTFQRVGLVERRSAGVILKQHTRLSDEISGDTAEVYQPIQYVHAQTDEYEDYLQEAIFELIYDGKVAEEVAEGLSTDLAENITR